MINPTFEPLRRFLTSLAPLPDSEWEAFAAGLQVTKFATGEALVRTGGSPRRTAFVLKGVFKAFYLIRDGSEHIRNFCAENTFAAAYAALLRNDPVSEVDVVAVGPAEFIDFDYETFRSRIPLHWTWQQIGRLMAERYYLLREGRQFELLTMSAEERLARFFAQFPTLPARISQKDMAAYIGITPASLSRLRSKAANSGKE